MVILHRVIYYNMITEPKHKAHELIKVSFEPLARMTGYNPARKDNRELFDTLEKHSKQVAKTFVNEIIKEVDIPQKDYWHKVNEQIDLL